MPEELLGAAPQSVFGLLAPTLYVPIRTPAFSYARTLVPIREFVERCRATFFPDVPPVS